MSSPWIVRVMINNCFLLCKGPKQQRTYIGWVNNFGDILVGGIDHQTGKLLPEVTIKKHLNKDDHANPSIMILQVRVTKMFTAKSLQIEAFQMAVLSKWWLVFSYHPSLNCL